MRPIGLVRVPGARRLPPLLQQVDEGAVLFESWHGKVSGNPRAISEELHRRESPLRQLWVTEPTGQGVPAWATAVPIDTHRYLAELGGTGFIVANNTMPAYFRKKRAATYLMTWHGTPLKRIAFDAPPSTSTATARYLNHLAREVATWDFLISPNRFSTSVMRDAFRFEGEILETGYPRNDQLSRPESETTRKEVRAGLGIGEDTCAVLYAPTFRDGERFSLELDLDAIEAEFSDGHVTLLRTHQLAGPVSGLEGRRGVRDVSAVHDVRELYLAADVLITDYSSVMFDFAVTGKPMLFFTYDLERYRDELRGFYFDFEADAPGPLLRTTEEVIEALRDLDAVSADSAGSYERFRDRFCHLDDGQAASRVVDAVFGSLGGTASSGAPTAT